MVKQGILIPKISHYFTNSYFPYWEAVADPGGWGKGAMRPPSGPVKISHKKDGRIDFMFLAPPPYPAAGSATGKIGIRGF